MSLEQVLEAWSIHDRIHRYLIEAIPDEALDAVSASKGRSVAEQFAHIHNVRLMWLKPAAPQLLEGLAKLDRDSLSRKSLSDGLEKSGTAIASLLRQAEADGGRVKSFKPHGMAFFAYLIAHEAHHRGQIALTLKQAGYPLDKKTAYGLWEWGAR